MKSEKNGKVTTSDLFLAAYISMRTNERPLFRREDSSKIFISFADTEAVRRAKGEYLNDDDGFRKFSQSYRAMRDEMFLFREAR